MAERAPDLPSLPITVRAVGIGLFCSIGISLIMAYNDYYLQNSLLIGNHFPIASITVLAALVLCVNTAASYFFRVPGLNSGELLLIWSMIGVAGGICSAGVMRYFPSWMVVPAYYTTPSNEFGTYILRHIPGWMVVSRDPDDPAVRWFMEGLPGDESIPWGRWIVPMLVWSGFMLSLYATVFALCALLYRQWASSERLIFPIVHLPVELCQAPASGRLLNSFLLNRLTWAGIGVPVFIYIVNGLRVYLPGIPEIPLHWGTWGLFPDRPWSEFHMDTAHMYFSVIGLSFLLTTEMSFSLWFFFFLYRLTYVYITWIGSGTTGFFGNWPDQVSVFQATGALLVLAVFLFWTARYCLKGWLARALIGKRDDALDLMPPRLSLFMVVFGLTGMLLWFILAGASWWLSLFGILIYLAILLVLTRIVAEAGLLFVQSNVVAYSVLTGIFPPGWLSGPTLVSFMMHRAITMHDLREIMMPYVVNGLKACDMVRMNMGRVLWVLAATALLGLGISAYGRIVTGYKYGGINMDQHANINTANMFITPVANLQKNPPAYDFIKVGDRNILPVRIAHVGIGAALSTIMLVLRARFLWWPLHPFGYLLCGTWAIGMTWFGIFLGWLAKSLVMTFVGAQAYRRLLPFFLGLVLGESLISAFWMMVSLILGAPGVAILPH